MGSTLTPPSKQIPAVPTSQTDEAIERRNRKRPAAQVIAAPSLASGAILKMLATALEQTPVAPADLVDALYAAAQTVSGGSLAQVEGTLATQATVLDVTSNVLLQQAFHLHHLDPAFERLLRLSLRAQAQSARTMEILAEIKQGPRVIIANQVNAARQQVVNNTSCSPVDDKSCSVRFAEEKNSAHGKTSFGLPPI